MWFCIENTFVNDYWKGDLSTCVFIYLEVSKVLISYNIQSIYQS